MKKYKEFWLHTDSIGGLTVHYVVSHHAYCHVIEKKAYDDLKVENTKLREVIEKIEGYALLADHSKKQYVWVCDIRSACEKALDKETK